MSFKNRNGQSLSINTLIIAALGLVVLVILGMLFFNKTQAFSSGLESCTAKFGKCDTEDLCNSNNGQVFRNTECEKKSTVCCVKLTTEQPSTTTSSSR